MRTPLIHQGEGQAGIDRLRAEHQAIHATIERLARMPAPELDSRSIGHGTAGGDSRKLRGIPAIARGVAGAIPGTNPEQALQRPQRPLS